MLVGGAIAAFGLATTMSVSGCGSQITDGGAAVGVDGLPVVPDRTPHEEGWRWESSLGIELAVPDEWGVNDTDCNQTSAPTIVRAQGAVNACLTQEPSTKEIVEISSSDPWGQEQDPPPSAEFPRQQLVIDGEPVERIEGKLPDGRAAGWLNFTETKNFVQARVRDQDLLHRIFDSVRVVTVDTHGCATARKSMKLKAPRATTLLPADAFEVSVCYFDQEQALRTSALLEGSEATKLVELLNRAEPGRNPEVPKNLCLDEEPPLADTILIARGERDGALVELSFSGCTGRGLTNGRTTSRLTIPMLEAIMHPLTVGYSYSPQGLE
jgi:hypothetical protein